MSTNDAHFRLLRLIEEQPELSQRKLAQAMGVSLGKVNYCLRALIEKGWIKAGRFSRNPHKGRYLYVLTPSGVEAIWRQTRLFLALKQREFDELRDEIAQLEARIERGPETGSGGSA